MVLAVGNVAQRSRMTLEVRAILKNYPAKSKGLSQKFKARKHRVFFTLLIWQSLNFVRIN